MQESNCLDSLGITIKGGLYNGYKITELHTACRRNRNAGYENSKEMVWLLKHGILRVQYPFPDQLMIHSQRPKVTACAEFDLWTKRLNRHIRRGSKGIGLIAINRNGYWKNYHKEIMYECGGRLLEGLEKQEVSVKFRLAVAASISYVLLARCGFDPWQCLKSENFKDVPDVNM